jgi:hypothetical protein
VADGYEGGSRSACSASHPPTRSRRRRAGGRDGARPALGEGARRRSAPSSRSSTRRGRLPGRPADAGEALVDPGSASRWAAMRVVRPGRGRRGAPVARHALRWGGVTARGIDCSGSSRRSTGASCTAPARRRPADRGGRRRGRALGSGDCCSTATTWRSGPASAPPATARSSTPPARAGASSRPRTTCLAARLLGVRRVFPRAPAAARRRPTSHGRVAALRPSARPSPTAQESSRMEYRQLGRSAFASRPSPSAPCLRRQGLLRAVGATQTMTRLGSSTVPRRSVNLIDTPTSTRTGCPRRSSADDQGPPRRVLLATKARFSMGEARTTRGPSRGTT